MPVGFTPSRAALRASHMPVFSTPLSMTMVSPVRVPSSSKKAVAVCSTALPSCMVTRGLATYSPMNRRARARSLTNMSISTPWPKASWTIMPVVSGSQTHSYSPGTMGRLSNSSSASRTTFSTPASISSSTSAPPRAEQGR